MHFILPCNHLPDYFPIRRRLAMGRTDRDRFALNSGVPVALDAGDADGERDDVRKIGRSHAHTRRNHRSSAVVADKTDSK